MISLRRLGFLLSQHIDRNIETPKEGASIFVLIVEANDWYAREWGNVWEKPDCKEVSTTVDDALTQDEFVIGVIILSLSD